MCHRSYLKIMALVGACLAAPSASYANIGMFLASGDGIRDITPYRGAISWDFGSVYCQDCRWGLAALWESSFAFWHGSHGPSQGNDKMFVATTGPVLRWQKMSPTVFNIQPYFEAGISPSWLSRREIGGRRLSTHFQFQDHVGIGFRFGSQQQFDITYRLMHYSNASIKRPNSGVNIQMLQLGVWFKS